MYFDTHCHLNFKVFDGRVGEVINEAKKAGVNNIIVPGTDVLTSQKAVEIVSSCHPERPPAGEAGSRGIYAAVGIHPHHVYQYQSSATQFFITRESLPRQEAGPLSKVKKISFASDLKEITKLLTHPKVVAIGEIGIDKHYYQKTKYKNYQINPELVEGQKDLFVKQIKLAHQYKKALIIHNREAKKDVLEILTNYQSLIPSYSSVFHCCEPDKDLLDFAVANKMFIGVDGDIFYRKDKQEFIKNVPLEMLVLETDSPYLSPDKRFPNEPKNIPLIAEFVAKLKNTSIKRLIEVTAENARKLFNLLFFLQP